MRNKRDIMFFPLMQYLTHGNQHRIEHYLRLVDSWTNTEFREHLRLSRNTANLLIGKHRFFSFFLLKLYPIITFLMNNYLKNDYISLVQIIIKPYNDCITDEIQQSGFIPQHSFGREPIAAKLSFLIFLWFMANTEPLRTIADRFNISVSSVFRVIRRVLAWLLTKLDDIIKWPQGNDVTETCHGFFLHKNISNVIGALDCTHIRIEKPSHNERNYCNRKKFFSLILQAVVDSNMRFTNVYCGEPGSLHDARVLRRSPLYITANREQEILFPNNAFILGDSAYPCLSWLIPPFRDNGYLTPQQREFNFLHSSTRMTVERAFGLLKGKFRRIKFFSEYRDISFVTDIIIAACILHNYCINVNDNLDFEDIDNQLLVNNDLEEDFGNEMQGDRRMQLFRELFPEI